VEQKRRFVLQATDCENLPEQIEERSASLAKKSADHSASSQRMGNHCRRGIP
jgi:hypothetical protein